MQHQLAMIMNVLYYTLAIFIFTHKDVGADPSTLKIVWLSGSDSDPLAVCNDGTPSAYYFKSTSRFENIHDWIIFLEGGGECYSEKSCYERSIYSTMMTSQYFTETIDLDGIFQEDDTKSAVANFNKVFIRYCTSDGWVGDAEPSELTWGWHFRGQRVLRATIRDLIIKNMITSQSSIVFGGSSAGARGMMNNVDFIRNLLPTGTTVIGVHLDSPYYIDIDPYTNDYVGFVKETQEIYRRYNVDNIIPSACAAMYPIDRWKCIFGQYRMPFLKTSFVLVASQFDSYQLGMNINEVPINGSFSDVRTNVYALKWSEKTSILLQDLSRLRNSTCNDGKNYILSWRCYNHAGTTSSIFYTLNAEGVTQNQALYHLIHDESTPSMTLWMDYCDDLNPIFSPQCHFI
jgi:hypothetical protein